MSGFHLFTLVGVPVWVSPWYLLLLGFVFMGGDVQSSVNYAVAITLSLLVHEFGHALLAKKYRLRPQVLLHGFGGLTAHAKADWDHQEALIIAAGPGAGILLGLLALGLRLVGGFPPVVDQFLYTLVLLNFFWSAFNLLPMWPMDGGQLYRIGAHRLLKPSLATKVVHGTAIAVGGLCLWASRALLADSILLPIILLMNIWENINAWQRGGAPGSRRESPQAKALFAEMEAAFARGDDRETVRLGHMLRAQAALTPANIAGLWAMLGVATTRLGKYDEALSYLKRAPLRADVVEAFAQCFFQLEQWSALEELVASPAFGTLDFEKQLVIRRSFAEARKPS